MRVMPLPFEVLGHTADLRLRATGQSPEELFRNALKGMVHVMKPDAKANDVSRPFSVSAVDADALLVDFLNEALYLASVHKEVYTDVDFHGLRDVHCEGELKGTAVEHFDKDIKAVTYHEARIAMNPEGYLEATLVFDI